MTLTVESATSEEGGGADIAAAVAGGDPVLAEGAVNVLLDYNERYAIASLRRP